MLPFADVQIFCASSVQNIWSNDEMPFFNQLFPGEADSHIYIKFNSNETIPYRLIRSKDYFIKVKSWVQSDFVLYARLLLKFLDA